MHIRQNRHGSTRNTHLYPWYLRPAYDLAGLYLDLGALPILATPFVASTTVPKRRWYRSLTSTIQSHITLHWLKRRAYTKPATLDNMLRTCCGGAPAMAGVDAATESCGKGTQPHVHATRWVLHLCRSDTPGPSPSHTCPNHTHTHTHTNETYGRTKRHGHDRMEHADAQLLALRDGAFGGRCTGGSPGATCTTSTNARGSGDGWVFTCG